MAEKRMFNKKIIDSDAFLDMPLSAQALYLIHSKQEVIEYIGKIRKEVENGSS